MLVGFKVPIPPGTLSQIPSCHATVNESWYDYIFDWELRKVLRKSSILAQ